jgi:carbamoyltransferase
MWVLGLHGSFGRAEHDPAAVLVHDGQIVAAAEEERFARTKHATGLMPTDAIRFCLTHAGISMRDIDQIAFPRATWTDFPPRLNAYLWYTFGHTPPVTYVDHHLAHAASAYLISGFDDSLIITADQAGDGVACAAYRAHNTTITPLETVPFPHSLGMFAALITQYLGFRSNNDEYKVMGLAPHGVASIDLSHLLTHPDGLPQLNVDVLHPEALRRHPVFHTDQLPMPATDQLPGLPRRRAPGTPLTDAHRDLAASAQRALQNALSAFVRRHHRPGDRRLCLAGGVAENSVAAGALACSGLVDDIYLGPACGDAGTALGAALLVAADHGHRPPRLTSTQLGPDITDPQVDQLLRSCSAPYQEVTDPAQAAATLVAQGRTVAWCQGRMEFGPRALGARSLLADPSQPDMRRHVNAIKRREQFRPFGPSVLAEHLDTLFERPPDAPFMSFTLPTLRSTPIAAASHIDTTSRPHAVPANTGDYRRLIEQVHARTGVPAVLNTSLNTGPEPIVATAEQALAFFASTPTDALLLGHALLCKKGV